MLNTLREECKKEENKGDEIKTKSVVQGHRYMIDLESVLKIEQKLWSILQEHYHLLSPANQNSNVFEH